MGDHSHLCPFQHSSAHSHHPRHHSPSDLLSMNYSSSPQPLSCIYSPAFTSVGLSDQSPCVAYRFDYKIYDNVRPDSDPTLFLLSFRTPGHRRSSRHPPSGSWSQLVTDCGVRGHRQGNRLSACLCSLTPPLLGSPAPRAPTAQTVAPPAAPQACPLAVCR